MHIYQYRVDYGLPGRRPNLLVRILGMLSSILALGLAALLGFFVFMVVLGMVVLGGLAWAVRLAWLKRQWHKMEEQAARPHPPPGGDYIDVEFTERD